MNEDILTVKEFGLLIGASRLTVMNLIKSGKILAFRLSDCPKSPWRIKATEVDRLISWELHKNSEKIEKKYE